MQFDAQALRTLIPGPFVVVARDASIVYASPAAAEALAIPVEQAVGARIDTLCADPAAAQSYFRSCARTSGMMPGVLRLLRGDGRVRALRCEGATVTATDGSRLVVLKLQAARRDDFILLSQKIEELNNEIDRRKRIQATMSRLQRMTAALVAAREVRDVQNVAVEQGVVLASADGGAIYAPAGDGDTLELQAHAGAEAPAWPHRLTAHDDHAVAEAFRTRSPHQHRGDGGWELSALPLTSATTCLGVLVVSYQRGRPRIPSEATLLSTLADQCAVALERARLYDAERNARERAIRAERRKDEFLAILGHELRNPLAPIKTATDLMRIRGAATFSRERAVIERQTRHLETLVNDLLDVARLTRGKVTLHRERHEVAGAIQRALEMHGPVFEKRDIELRTNVPQQGLELTADHDRIAQIVGNLLDNAAKYTDSGGRVELSAAREDSWIVIRVLDTGVGIPPESLSNVFDMFVQEGKSRIGGLGLGLAIVRNLVELHGGEVEARSEGLGKGSEFVVRLPVAADDGAPAQRQEPAEAPSAAGRNLRILIVDDNEDAAQLLAAGLAAEGYRTHYVLDGPSALRAVEERAFDVALLDIGLPIMDGYELAQRLRAHPVTASMPLIAVTAYGQEEDRRRVLEAGFRRHVVKPVDLRELSSQILDVV